MKELVKPNSNEQKQRSLESYCETVCSGTETCNRACECRSYTNNSVTEDDDILF